MPIEEPKLPPMPTSTLAVESFKPDPGLDDAGNPESGKQARLDAELERLHTAGIPVPGIEIKVDKMVAKVWLEDLEVECSNKIFGDRVRVVLERAVEVIAPLWS